MQKKATEHLLALLFCALFCAVAARANPAFAAGRPISSSGLYACTCEVMCETGKPDKDCLVCLTDETVCAGKTISKPVPSATPEPTPAPAPTPTPAPAPTPTSESANMETVDRFEPAEPSPTPSISIEIEPETTTDAQNTNNFLPDMSFLMNMLSATNEPVATVETQTDEQEETDAASSNISLPTTEPASTGTVAVKGGTNRKFKVDQNTEPEPSVTPEPVTSAEPAAPNPLTPDGQGTVVDNASSNEGKEFFTIATQNENIFYLVIDRQRENENVYFLNAVTESDLMALAEKDADQPVESAIPEPEPVCSCREQCVPGEVDVNCPVCVLNLNGCTGTPSEDDSDSEPAAAEKESSGMTIFVILLAVLAAGGAGYYIKIYKPKKELEDADDYDDWEDEETINEDDAPAPVSVPTSAPEPTFYEEPDEPDEPDDLADDEDYV